MMISRLTQCAAATAAAAATLAPSASATPISKTTSFVNQSRKVMCGIEIHAPNKPATKVLCAAHGIPAPKKGGIGDPGFVQIGVLGTPQTLRLSQNSFVAGTTARLRRGRLWNQLGVTCHTALVTVMCFNGDNHGFIIGNGRYKVF
jgi:hypothetical protein